MTATHKASLRNIEVGDEVILANFRTTYPSMTLRKVTHVTPTQFRVQVGGSTKRFRKADGEEIGAVSQRFSDKALAPLAPWSRISETDKRTNLDRMNEVRAQRKEVQRKNILRNAIIDHLNNQTSTVEELEAVAAALGITVALGANA